MPGKHAYHYGIAAYRTNESTKPNAVMLYRFRGKRDRSAWLAASPSRVGITRDIARIIFKEFRDYGTNAKHWVSMETLANETCRGIERTVRIPCWYFVALDGSVITAPWEVIEHVK